MGKETFWVSTGASGGLEHQEVGGGRGSLLLVVVPKPSPPFPVPYCTPVCWKNSVTPGIALPSSHKKKTKQSTPLKVIAASIL